MIRAGILFILFSFSLSPSFSQSQRSSGTSDVFDKMKNELVELSARSAIINKQISFSKINLLDKRYDSTAVGYIRYDNPRKEYAKLVTVNSLGNELQVFLDRNFNKNTSAGSPELLVVVRKFWFDKEYDFKSNNYNSPPFLYFLTLGVDFYYVSDDKYIPVMKKDTVVELQQKIKEPLKGIIIGESVLTVFNEFVGSLPATPANRRRLTFEEVNQYYDKNLDQPVLTGQMKKGVYMNFNEFKNNSPAYTNFEVRETKLADDVYILNENNDAAVRNVWGYCDGKNLFIKLGMNFFPLVRQGNGFSVLGNDQLTHKTGSYTPSYNKNATAAENMGTTALGNLLFTKDKFKLYLVPLEVDMETGRVY